MDFETRRDGRISLVDQMSWQPYKFPLLLQLIVSKESFIMSLFCPSLFDGCLSCFCVIVTSSFIGFNKVNIMMNYIYVCNLMYVCLKQCCCLGICRCWLWASLYLYAYMAYEWEKPQSFEFFLTHLKTSWFRNQVTFSSLGVRFLCHLAFWPPACCYCD